MILIAIFLGQVFGGIINWASDSLIEFSNSGNSSEPTVNAPIRMAFWSLLASSLFRRRLYYRDKNAWSLLLVEVISGLLFAFLWHRLGFTPPFFFLAAICSFLILTALIDLKYRLVLNVLVLPSIGAIILFQAIPIRQTTWLSFLGGLTAFFLFLLVALVAPGRLGGGDIKLAAFLGFLFGLPYVFWALVASALMGGVTAVLLLLTKQWHLNSRIPYAPFLCLGGLIAIFYDPTPWLFARY